nr:MAG TPA: Protein of unknown function (DUF739) [Caudoviricetes sp.]
MLKDTIIKLPMEVRELNINMSFYDVIKGLGVNNAYEGIKILKVKYGISYERIAGVMGISAGLLRTVMSAGSFETLVSEQRLASAIEDIQIFYLGDTFAEYHYKEKE